MAPSRPGQINHHEMAGLAGAWTSGTVRGHLRDEGWGAAHGCPGITLAADGTEVAVHILESPDLLAHWPRLDRLEGPGYRRSLTMAETPDGPLCVSIYELAPGGPRA